MERRTLERLIFYLLLVAIAVNLLAIFYALLRRSQRCPGGRRKTSVDALVANTLSLHFPSEFKAHFHGNGIKVHKIARMFLSAGRVENASYDISSSGARWRWQSIDEAPLATTVVWADAVETPFLQTRRMTTNTTGLIFQDVLYFRPGVDYDDVVNGKLDVFQFALTKDARGEILYEYGDADVVMRLEIVNGVVGNPAYTAESKFRGVPATEVVGVSTG